VVYSPYGIILVLNAGADFHCTTTRYGRTYIGRRQRTGTDPAWGGQGEIGKSFVRALFRQFPKARHG
jgi:hypothetical protein